MLEKIQYILGISIFISQTKIKSEKRKIFVTFMRGANSHKLMLHEFTLINGIRVLELNYQQHFSVMLLFS